MPPTPELRNRTRYVRIIKVLQKTKSEYHPQPDRHVRITAEIVKQLQTVRKRSRPRRQRVKLFHWLRKYLVRYRAQRVGYQHLLRQTDNKSLHTVTDLLKRDFPILYLIRNIVILYYRTRYQLRKQRDVKRQFVQILLYRTVPAVDVQKIRHRLKRVKRYPYRHDDFNKLNIQRKQSVDVLRYKIEIFEVTQKT